MTPEPIRNANKIIGTQGHGPLRLLLWLFLLLWGPPHWPLSSQLRAGHTDSWGLLGPTDTCRHSELLMLQTKQEKKIAFPLCVLSKSPLNTSHEQSLNGNQLAGDGGKCGFWTLSTCMTEKGIEERVRAMSQQTELSHHAGQSHQTPLL